uniref:Glutaredoxin-like protein n=1 Tax=Oryza meridionalis TaxID=40149 RepID=A0A0E0CRY9_9ORYZ
MAAAAAAALTVLPRAAGVLRLSQHGRAASRLLCAAAGDGEASPAPRRLVLYTKPGCCLCDGLKEKLHAAFLLAGTPYSLASLELQASRLDHVRGFRAFSPLGGFILRSWGLCFDQERDITTNPDWEQMYQYEIPVLAKVLPDGSEIIASSKRGARAEESGGGTVIPPGNPKISKQCGSPKTDDVKDKFDCSSKESVLTRKYPRVIIRDGF